MSYLNTKTKGGAEINVYPGLIAVVQVKAKKATFYCIMGTVSAMTIASMKALKDWLTKHNIQFFHISENKIACRPHVLGRGEDDELLYHPAFYNALNKEEKTLFMSHSFGERYRRRLRKGSDNHLLNSNNSAKSNAVKNGSSNIKSDIKRKKKIVSGIKRNFIKSKKKL